MIINSTLINKLEQEVHDLQDESDSLQLAIKLIAQGKYCRHGNETQSSAPGHCPEEWNKAHTNNKQLTWYKTYAIKFHFINYLNQQ